MEVDYIKYSYIMFAFALCFGVGLIANVVPGTLNAASTSQQIVVLNGTAYWGYVAVGTYCQCETGALNTAFASSYSIPVPYSYTQSLISNNDPNAQNVKNWYYTQLDAYAKSLGSQVYFGTDPEYGTAYTNSWGYDWKVQCLGPGAQNGNGGTFDDGNACFWAMLWVNRAAAYPAALNIPTPTASSSSIIYGSTVQLSDSGASGGTGGYSYEWFYLSPGQSTWTGTSAYGTSWTAPPSSTGTYGFKLVVKDSNGDTATSAPVYVQVNQQPVSNLAVSLTATPSTLTLGNPLTLTATISGSTATPFQVELYQGTSSTCSQDTINKASGTTNTQSLAIPLTSASAAYPTSSTYYCVRVHDNNGNVAYSSTVYVSVSKPVPGAPLSVSILPTSALINPGQSVTLSATASGGVSPYTYSWVSGTSSSCSSDNTAAGTSNPLTVSPTSNTFYCVKVQDSASNTVLSSTSSITITAVPVTPPIPPAPQPSCINCGNSGSAGPKMQPILASVQKNATCSIAINMTPSVTTQFTVNNVMFTAYDKYTFSNYADYFINGSVRALYPGNVYYLMNGTKKAYTAEINLSSIQPVNYTSPVRVSSLSICYVNKTTTQPNRPPPVFVPVNLNLSINSSNYMIKASSSAINDTVDIFIGGKVVSSGKGAASYNAMWYPAGRYVVTGKDIDSGTFINSTLVKPLFAPQLTFTKICANNTEEVYTCTTDMKIISHNNALLGTLYINGKPVNATNNTLNYTISARGIYNITFKTSGSDIYSANSISYTFQDGSTYDYLPSVLAIVLSTCAIALLVLARRVRKDEELRTA